MNRKNIALLIILMLVFFAGCSKKNDQELDPQIAGANPLLSEDRSGVSYKSEKLYEISDKIWCSTYSDEKYYFACTSYDDETSEVDYYISEYSVLDNKYSTICNIDWEDIRVAAGKTNDDAIRMSFFSKGIDIKDNNIWILWEAGLFHDGEGTAYKNEYYILNFSMNGELMQAIFIGDSDSLAEGNVTSVLALSGMINYSDNTYINSDRGVYVFDRDYKYIGKSELPEDAVYTYGIVEMYEGVYLYFYTSSNNSAYVKIDVDGNKIILNKNRIEGLEVAGDYAPIVLNERTIAFADYWGLALADIPTGDEVMLFNWSDCGIRYDGRSSINITKDGEYIVLSDDIQSGIKRIYRIIEETDTDNIATLTIASWLPNSSMNIAVAEYNSNHSESHITYKVYCGEGTDYDIAITNLNLDINGNNCPDMLILDDMDINNLTEKGVLLDLTSFLDQSDNLSRDDYYSNVINGYNYNNQLIGIPQTFMVKTLVGRTVTSGANEGWTLNEMLVCGTQFAGTPMVQYVDKSSVLRELLKLSMSEFVDYKNSEAHFDSNEFCELLKYSNTYTDSFDWSNVTYGFPGVLAGETLYSNGYIANYGQFMEIVSIFGDDYVIKGYPTPDGTWGNIIEPCNIVGITVKCEQTNIAWDFIEYLAEESATENIYGDIELFSARKSVNEALAEKLMSQEGELFFEVCYEDGTEVNIDYPTQDDIDKLFRIIESGIIITEDYSSVWTIIDEESGAFYSGQKSAEEVVDVIQSRVQLYLDEN